MYVVDNLAVEPNASLRDYSTCLSARLFKTASGNQINQIYLAVYDLVSRDVEVRNLVRKSTLATAAMNAAEFSRCLFRILG